MLDDGRITDGQGRVVNFKNTIIIMTSNLGSEFILEDMQKGYGCEITEESKERVNALLKRTFRPEFLNRLDEIVIFTPLSESAVAKIVDIMLNKLASRLERQQIQLSVTEEAKRFIVANGYDVIYGARPLRRFIESKIETAVAKVLLGGNLKQKGIINVTVKNDDIFVE